MLSDREIYRTAARMITRHGTDARAEVSARADTLYERGDVVGWEIGMRIMDAIRNLEAEAHEPSLH